MATQEELLQAKQDRIEELHRCQPGKTALLVIDMQNGFLAPGAALELPNARSIIPNVQALVEGCRERNVPVIFTEYVYSPKIPCMRGDPFGPEHLPAQEGKPTGFGHPSSNCLIEGEHPGSGPESATVIDALEPEGNELVIQGFAYDKFYGTPLDLALRSMGIQFLLFTGVTTDVCVNHTLMSASTREYRATAVTDAMATVDPAVQEACLKIWQNKFARLKSTAEILRELESFQKKNPANNI